VPAFGHIETCGEQASRRVEQKGEIHRGQFFALPGHCFQGEQAALRLVAGLAQTACEPGERLWHFLVRRREFGPELLHCRLDQRTQRMIEACDLAQRRPVVEPGELLVEPCQRWRESALVAFRLLLIFDLRC
jgi:hypothetical protein